MFLLDKCFSEWYHSTFMSRQEPQDFAAVVIDSLKFAGGHERIVGSLALAKCLRLTDMLASTEGSLDYALEGIAFTGSLAGRVGLHLQVSGQLRLHCQRCLAEVVFDCKIDNRLLLVTEEVGADAWPEDELEAEDFDAMPASQAMSLQMLIEDEVLLSLPLVPRHADCVVPGLRMDDADPAEQEKGPSPFRVLAGLKKH